MREALPPRLAPALIGHVAQGPLAGRTVYDALYDTRPAELLLEALRTQARIGGLRFERNHDQEIRTGLVPRLMTAEQSNSSVVYGDTFILKLLRRIVPGVNPDLELPLALARAGCPRVPAPAAWMTADLGGEPWVLGVLQPYVQGATDGWELALRELAKGEDFAAEARALGRATAEVHTALARALPTVTSATAGWSTWSRAWSGGWRTPRSPSRRCGRTSRGCTRRSRRWPAWPPRAAPGPPSGSTAICISGSACARRPATGR